MNVQDKSIQSEGLAAAGRLPADLEKREALVERLTEVMADRGWSIAETARRMDKSDGLISQWLSGKYKGRIDTTNAVVEQFLAQLERQDSAEALMPVSPPFIETGFARKVWNAILAAQMMPALTMVCAEAGMGKTMTAKAYAGSNRHAHLVTMHPRSGTLQGALNQVMSGLGIHQPNGARQISAIGERLRATGTNRVLIVDESQNLSDQAINQLRHFSDLYGCGVALLGNSETNGRFSLWGEAAGAGGSRRNTQIRSRVAMKVVEAAPSKADIGAFLDAWRIAASDQRQFLTAVGTKPGALREVDYTIKLAMFIANGEERPLTLADLRAAYDNRGTGA